MIMNRSLEKFVVTRNYVQGVAMGAEWCDRPRQHRPRGKEMGSKLNTLNGKNIFSLLENIKQNEGELNVVKNDCGF